MLTFKNIMPQCYYYTEESFLEGRLIVRQCQHKNCLYNQHCSWLFAKGEPKFARHTLSMR